MRQRRQQEQLLKEITERRRQQMDKEKEARDKLKQVILQYCFNGKL